MCFNKCDWCDCGEEVFVVQTTRKTPGICCLSNNSQEFFRLIDLLCAYLRIQVILLGGRRMLGDSAFVDN